MQRTVVKAAGTKAIDEVPSLLFRRMQTKNQTHSNNALFPRALSCVIVVDFVTRFAANIAFVAGVVVTVGAVLDSVDYYNYHLHPQLHKHQHQEQERLLSVLPSSHWSAHHEAL